jgi:hypothetical protein
MGRSRSWAGVSRSCEPEANIVSAGLDALSPARPAGSLDGCHAADGLTMAPYSCTGPPRRAQVLSGPALCHSGAPTHYGVDWHLRLARPLSKKMRGLWVWLVTDHSPLLCVLVTRGLSLPPLRPSTGPPWRTLSALPLTFLAPLQPALPWMLCSGFGLAERSSSCSSHGVLVPAHAGCRSFGINGGGLSTLSRGLGRRLRALCMLLYTPTDPNFDLPPSKPLRHVRPRARLNTARGR